MTHKQIRDISIVIMFVFLSAIIIYPMAFGPGNTDGGQDPVDVAAPPK